MASIWNNGISISIFGESHSAGIGVVMDNLPPGEPIDLDKVKAFMARRAPSREAASTTRKEPDRPKFFSGLYENTTTGTPLSALIENMDTRSQDYREMQTLARPGHADYTGHLRYRGFNDIRGGGHFSGRLTAPLTLAGAICGQILERRGIYTGAHLLQVEKAKDSAFDPITVSREEILSLREKDFPTIDKEAAEQMREIIAEARGNLDSVGGIIECAVVGMPPGVGSPMFDGLENTLASILFGIPAVKGVEFGEGFHSAMLHGSENNDPFYMDERGDVKTTTNHHGGILGGISSGMPICLRVAMKPTASISQQQQTIDYKKREDASLLIRGRHDACVAVRAVPVVEAAVNIALLSHLVKQNLL